MLIEQRAIDSIRPYPKNARKIPQSAVDSVAKSITEFGWRQPIVVDEAGEIIIGHVRRLAAIKLGLVEVPVHVAIGLSAAKVKALRLMDNRSHEDATWEPELLTSELLELRGLELDLGMTGFNLPELDRMLGPTPGLTDADEVPPVPEAPVTQPGDLWLLGDHRVLCGDCRDMATIKLLFESSRANLVFTSPPYAEQREYDSSSGFKPVPPDEYVAWYADVAANVAAVLADDGSYFLNIKEHADDGERNLYVKDLVIAHRRQWAWRFVDEFCWRKTDNGVPGGWNNRFKNAWEPVFHFCRQQQIKFRPKRVGHESEDCFDYSPSNPKSTSGSGLLGTGARGSAAGKQGASDADGRFAGVARPSNVVEVKSESSQGTHSAPFPRALVEFFVLAFSDPDEVVFDPFMGSGSTLIAAHQNNRIGYGTELSPAYCDVIVTRWQNLTGKEATLAGHGSTFEHVKYGRRLAIQDALKEEAIVAAEARI